MADLTSTGLTILTQAEILALIEVDQRAEVSAELDQSTSSPLGQINRLFARAIRLQEEALQAVASGLDPDAASGDALFRLGALTGTYREAATSSRVAVLCTLAAGSYAVGALAATPAGRPTERFVSITSHVVAAPGGVSVTFEAEDTGAIQVAANTLGIASPVAGWTAIVSHPAATAGLEIETESAFRIRRAGEVEAPGSASAAGIAADLSRTIAAIESVTVIENDTDGVVDSIPAHAIETIVFGPEVPTAADDDIVAAQILESKAAGIATYGTTSRTVLDTQGVSHAVRFTRPTAVTVLVTLTAQVDALTYAGDAAVASAIAAGAALLLPGRDVSWSNVVSWASAVVGVYRVSAVTIGGVSFGTSVITSRQIASILIANVTVVSAEVSP